MGERREVSTPLKEVQVIPLNDYMLGNDAPSAKPCCKTTYIPIVTMDLKSSTFKRMNGHSRLPLVKERVDECAASLV